MIWSDHKSGELFQPGATTDTDTQMNKLEQIIADIKKLEQELFVELQKKQDEYFYVIKGKKIQFEEETRKYHKTLATKLHVYLANASIPVILTAPIIWSCLIPAAMMDLFVSIYHSICFRVYGIPLVRRSDYIIIDRHNLQYLNPIEKLNCLYCGYFSGLIAYVQEIAARTEQYWCPIKHARKSLMIHRRYHKFIEYGDSQYYQQRLADLRKSFDDVREKT
jgi:hypothetical protein